MHISTIDAQWTVHWLGIPYFVESVYRGHLYGVVTSEEDSVDPVTSGKILHKFFKLKLNKSMIT